MHSHLKFFQNGFEVLKKLEPVLHQAQVGGASGASAGSAWPG
jgi:hypothetical protein